MIESPDGLWTLKEGDTPRTIAQYVYGDGHRYADLLKANKDREWVPGAQVVVPNKNCYSTFVREGESPHDVIRRLFPNQMPHLFIDRFLEWNGGTVDLEVNQFVCIPQAR